MPTVLGPDGDALDLRFTGADGREHTTSAVVLVSNDPRTCRKARGTRSGPSPASPRVAPPNDTSDPGSDDRRLTACASSSRRRGGSATCRSTERSCSSRPASHQPLVLATSGAAPTPRRLDRPLRPRVRVLPRRLSVRLAAHHAPPSCSALAPATELRTGMVESSALRLSTAPRCTSRSGQARGSPAASRVWGARRDPAAESHTESGQAGG